jgi:hypothetical protein
MQLLLPACRKVCQAEQDFAYASQISLHKINKINLVILYKMLKMLSLYTDILYTADICRNSYEELRPEELQNYLFVCFLFTLLRYGVSLGRLCPSFLRGGSHV